MTSESRGNDPVASRPRPEAVRALTRGRKGRCCRAAFLAAYPVREAGGAAHREYWIPAEDLAAFNRAIVGKIEVVAEFSQRAG